MYLQLDLGAKQVVDEARAVSADLGQQRLRGVLVDAGVQEEADPPRHAQIGQQASALGRQLGGRARRTDVRAGRRVGVMNVAHRRQVQARHRRQAVRQPVARVAQHLGGRGLAIDDHVGGERPVGEEPPLRAVRQPLRVGGRDVRQDVGAIDGRRRRRDARLPERLGYVPFVRRPAVERAAAAGAHVRAR